VIRHLTNAKSKLHGTTLMPLDLHCTACAADTEVGLRVQMLTMDPVCPSCPWAERERTAVELISANQRQRTNILIKLQNERGLDEVAIVEGMMRQCRLALAIRYGTQA
jgi:hypothetical protein